MYFQQTPAAIAGQTLIDPRTKSLTFINDAQRCAWFEKGLGYIIEAKRVQLVAVRLSRDLSSSASSALTTTTASLHVMRPKDLPDMDEMMLTRLHCEIADFCE